MRRLFLPVTVAALVGAVSASVFFLANDESRGGTQASSASTNASEQSSTTTGTPSGQRQEVSSSSLTATEIYQRDASGVVAIKAVTPEGEDSGTGVVLNESGLILTNNHVISEASNISVSPGKSASYSRPATLVGADANSDLALIKINPSGLGLKPLKLTSSSSVEVGDPVYAIGNPYGLDETLTRGIVSALGREIQAPDGASIKDAIQTDAALNPGNSGGPLLNEHGEVIGINSQIASDTASVEGSQPGSTGVGFAISSNTVAEVVKLIKAGEGTTSQSRTRESIEARSPYENEASPYGTESAPYGAVGSPYRSAYPYRSESGANDAEAVEGLGTSTATGEGQTTVIIP